MLIALLVALPAARHAGSNVTSRFATTLRIVDDGTAELGSYNTQTNDVALHEGGYYSDKAPGVSLILIPAYALVRSITRDFDSARHLCRLLTLLPLVLLTCAFLMRHLRKQGVDETVALAATAIYAVGTVAWAYHFMLYSHGFVSALLLVGSLLLMDYRRGGQSDKAKLAVSGLCFGLSIVFEYPTAVIGGAAGLYLLSFEKNYRRIAVFAALGALLPALVILIYNGAVFGDPFHIGYAQVKSDYYRQQMSHGFMGIGPPKLSGLYHLLFGPAKGLFFWSPIFFYCFAGLAAMIKDSPREGIFMTGAACLYILIFSGHFEVSGGAGLGPRHLTPLTGLLVYAGALPAARVTGWKRGAFFGLAIMSSIMSVIGVFSEAQMPDRVVNTLHEFALPMLAQGVGPGNILGLPDWAALILALLLMTALWVVIFGADHELLKSQRNYRYGAFFTAIICLAFYLGVAPYLGRTDQGVLHQVKGNHFMMRNDFDQAAWEYQHAYKNRKDPYILLYWSKALRKCGKIEEAVDLYNQWLEIKPKNETEP